MQYKKNENKNLIFYLYIERNATNKFIYIIYNKFIRILKLFYKIKIIKHKLFFYLYKTNIINKYNIF